MGTRDHDQIRRISQIEVKNEGLHLKFRSDGRRIDKDQRCRIIDCLSWAANVGNLVVVEVAHTALPHSHLARNINAVADRLVG